MKLQDMSTLEITNAFYDSITDEVDDREDVDELSERLSSQSYYFKKGLAKDLSTEFIINEVDHYGGEGRGDNYYDVFKIQRIQDEDDFVFIKISGYYSSYNGTEYESFDDAVSKVQPKEKTIIVYE